jgi:hypothetical protein
MADIDMLEYQPGKSPRRFASVHPVEYNRNILPDGRAWSSHRIDPGSCRSGHATPTMRIRFNSRISTWAFRLAALVAGWPLIALIDCQRGWRLFVMAAGTEWVESDNR